MNIWGRLVAAQFIVAIISLKERVATTFISFAEEFAVKKFTMVITITTTTIAKLVTITMTIIIIVQLH